jgi:WD40 repeat protein/predicted Ser/Thr protein kinase
LCPRCLVVGALKETTDATDALEHVGKYELVGEIGRGGMGVVYQAMDSALHRPVALKLLPPGLLASRDATRRFFTEAQAAARLNHPNIVPIYEIGDGSQGQPFMAMEYVAGGTLAERLKKGPLAPVVSAALLEKIARGIQHAHERGILHRDIKPGNILLKDGDEPLIADFGLARLLESDSSLTRTGAMLGTPSYLAPELVDGRGRESTTAADVYSLGATLYECLAGHPPFVADTTPALVRRIAEEEPPRLSKTDSSTTNSIVDRDLETICLKCLEKEPQKRYFSATALADDLARWRRGEPIEARPSAVAERIVKWARRRPAIAALTVSLLAVGLSGLTGVLLELRRALDGERAARLNEYAADMNVVNQALLSGDPGRARALLEQYIPKPGQPDLRDWEWNYFYSEATHNDALADLGQMSGPVWWACFSKDGQRLATADLIGDLYLWDVRTCALVAKARQSNVVSAIQFTPDGRFLVTSSGAGSLTNSAMRWWIVPELREARPPLVISNLIQALPSPDGRQWFVVGAGFFKRFAIDGKAESPASGVPQKYPPAGFGVFSPDGSYFAYETGSGTARHLAVWNLTQDTTRIFAGHHWREGFPYTISGLAFAPEDNALASSGFDGVVRVWSLRPKSPDESARELSDTGGGIIELVYARGGKWLAGGSADESIHLWDTQTWKLAGQLRGNKSTVAAMAVSPDGALLASGAMDGEVKLWAAAPPASRRTVLPLPGYLVGATDEGMALSPDGGYLLTRDTSKQTYQLWSTGTPELITAGAPPPGFEYPSAVSPGGQWLAFFGEQGTRLVPINVSTSMPSRTLTNAWIRQFSADRRLLLGLDLSHTAQVFDAESGLELARAATGIQSDWRSLAISLDNEWIGVGFFDGSVLAWNWRTHRIQRWENGTRTPVSGVAFSPDSLQLAAVSYDSRARVYDLASGRERYHITASSFELDAVAWSSTGRRLVTGSSDGLVRVWDLDTTPVREIAVLPGHTNAVQAAAFAPDGTLVTVSRDSLRVWRTDQAAR